jgi:hypothetical protein
MNKQTLKSHFVQGIIGLSVVLALLMPVHAQSNLDVTAAVPFDFVAGNERLPAGEYSVRALTTAQGVLVIRNRDEGTNLVRLTNSTQRPVPTERAMLVFRRYEDKYFLYQVWTTGEVSGYELPKSRTERSVERDLTNARSDRGKAIGVEIVTITANSQ